MSITIRRADYMDVDALVPLFDGYRQFYKWPSDETLARSFLSERLRAEEAIVFIADVDHQPVGFTLLYPSFSSTAAGRIFVLNDLFVKPDARTAGVGSALLQAGADFGRAEGAIRLTLSTAIDNTTAQAVYERMGWVRNTAFFTYNLTL